MSESLLEKVEASLHKKEDPQEKPSDLLAQVRDTLEHEKARTHEMLMEEHHRMQHDKKHPKGFGANARRYAGMGARSLIGGVVPAAADLLALPVALPMAVAGKNIFPSSYIKEAIDSYTGGQYAPQTRGEHILTGALEGGASPLTGIAKTISKGVAHYAPKLTEVGSQYMPKIAKKYGEFVGKALAPTAANVGAGTLGGAASGYMASDTEPSYISSDLAKAVLAGVVGGKLGNVATKAESRQALAHAIAHPARWAASKFGTNWALRDPKIGGKFIESYAHKNGLIPELADVDIEKVGKDIGKSAKEYHGRMSEKHRSQMEQIHEKGKGLYVSLHEPLSKAIESLENASHPAIADAWMKGQLGKTIRNILGVGEKLTHNEFLELLHTHPEITHRPVSHAAAHELRQMVDDLLSLKEHLGISTKQTKDIKGLSAGIRNAYLRAAEEHSPQLGQMWKTFNRGYENYAKNKVPKLNELRKHEGSPWDTHEASMSKLSRGAEMPTFVHETLATPERQEEYAKSLLHELGRTDIGDIDVSQLRNKVSGLRRPGKQAVLDFAGPELRKKIDDTFEVLRKHEGNKELLPSAAEIYAHKENLNVPINVTKKIGRHLYAKMWERPAFQEALEAEFTGKGRTAHKEAKKLQRATESTLLRKQMAHQLKNATQNALKINIGNPTNIIPDEEKEYS